MLVHKVMIGTFLLFMAFCAVAQTHTIVVLTLRSLPAPSVPQDCLDETHIYYLDQGIKAEQAIQQAVAQPLDHQKAQARAKRVIQQLAPVIENATQGLFMAYRLGIHRVPAIVFDDDTIILGTLDVGLAKSRYLTYLNEQRLGVKAW